MQNLLPPSKAHSNWFLPNLFCYDSCYTLPQVILQHLNWPVNLSDIQKKYRYGKSNKTKIERQSFLFSPYM